MANRGTKIEYYAFLSDDGSCEPWSNEKQISYAFAARPVDTGIGLKGALD